MVRVGPQRYGGGLGQGGLRCFTLHMKAPGSLLSFFCTSLLMEPIPFELHAHIHILFIEIYYNIISRVTLGFPHYFSCRPFLITFEYTFPNSRICVTCLRFNRFSVQTAGYKKLKVKVNFTP